MRPSKTFQDLLAHQRAYNERLHLVASENSLLPAARIAFLSDIINRYYFPLPEYRHWAFPGNEHIEAIYERCKTFLQKRTGGKYINLRPISGINAMTIALAALAKDGETIGTIAPENGGHMITRAIARRFGVRALPIPYDNSGFRIDTESLPVFVQKNKISLIYLDQAHVLFPLNLKEAKSALPNLVKIYYDGSHVLGLIFGNSFQNPLSEGATFLGGNTHKTIPGPHKAFIATNDKGFSEQVNLYSNVFVSHDHPADVAALAIVLEEMEETWETYAKQTVKNAQALAKALDKKGFSVAAKELGFTRSHQIWVDITPHMEPFEAVMTLAQCGIITNTIHAPTIPNRLAIRIGVQEITYLGAREPVMEYIAEIFEGVFAKKHRSHEEVRKQVAGIKKSLGTVHDEDLLELLSKKMAR